MTLAAQQVSCRSGCKAQRFDPDKHIPRFHRRSQRHWSSSLRKESVNSKETLTAFQVQPSSDLISALALLMATIVTPTAAPLQWQYSVGKPRPLLARFRWRRLLERFSRGPRSVFWAPPDFLPFRRAEPSREVKSFPTDCRKRTKKSRSFLTSSRAFTLPALPVRLRVAYTPPQVRCQTAVAVLSPPIRSSVPTLARCLRSECGLYSIDTGKDSKLSFLSQTSWSRVDPVKNRNS